MNDTNPNIAAIYDGMFASLSHEERAMKGCSMHDSSKKIVLSQIVSSQKTRADLMAELFIRFYGQEFSAERLKLILHAIRRFHSEDPAGSA